MQQNRSADSSQPHDVERHRQHDHERGAELDAREQRVESREAVLANRAVREQELLVDADKRDDEANVRDAVANRRDVAAGLEEFVEEPVDTRTLRAREAASSDRADSRADRSASKTDRSHLTDDRDRSTSS